MICASIELHPGPFLVAFLGAIEGAQMGKIRGNNDGPGGRNETYNIGRSENVPRSQVVREIKQGLHADNHIIKVNGREYARDNPDGSKRDNVNR